MMFLAKKFKKAAFQQNLKQWESPGLCQSTSIHTCLCSPRTPPPASKHTNPSAGASRSACPTKPYIIIIMSLTIAFDVSTPPRTPRRGAHSQIGWLCEPLNYEVSFLFLLSMCVFDGLFSALISGQKRTCLGCYTPYGYRLASFGRQCR